jgi:Rieske Fe-S protein
MSNREHSEPIAEPTPPGQPRRRFLQQASGLGMAAALVAGYGRFAGVALEFLYPSRAAAEDWQFVASVETFKKGDTMSYKAPRGDRVTITRQWDLGGEDDFIALSSTCPHLGCQVHWESNNNRYFCPCHNGVFDPSGKGIGGPPGDAGQSLPSFPLKIANGLLYIRVPMEKLPSSSEQA